MRRDSKSSLRNVCLQCVKCVQIRSYFWSVFSCIRTEYFPVFGLKTEIYGVNFRTQSE